MLVLDSNVVLRYCGAADDFSQFGREDLIAPPLMWSEFRSTLHEALWRREVSPDQALATLERLRAAPVVARIHPGAGDEAWRVAEEFGWAKTYDAEYVALARLTGSRLVTLDHRLRRGADRLGFVIGLDEL